VNLTVTKRIAGSDKMRSRVTRCQRGFSLTELLIAMVLTGVVSTAVYSTYRSQQQAYVKSSDACLVQQNLRAAMYHLERAVRMAGFNPTGKPMDVGFSGVATATQGQVTLAYDDDESGVCETDETYVFQRNATVNTLDMTQGGGTAQTLAEDITALSFTFLDANNTPSTANIASVDITITGSRGTHTSTLTSRVFCRNLAL
jgi:type IV pilus assembly protein PilW